MIVKDLSLYKNKEYFAIIIGSGPAGISTALGLERKKINSLIVEAGDISINDYNLEFLKGFNVGNEYSDIEISRLRQFGGTSGLWGGNCNPLDESDFSEWPITKKDLDVHKYEAKKILNLKKDFFSDKFSKNLKIFNRVWSNVKFGEKYYEYIKKSKYIHLSLNTIFENFKGTNGFIEAANVSKNKTKYSLNSKFYILSCGGIENSRLLLWSKFKNPNLFRLPLPIGNYYMDHPFHNVGAGLINYNMFKKYNTYNNIYNSPSIGCDTKMLLSSNKEFLKEKKILNSGLYVDFKNLDTKNTFFNQLKCMAPKFIKNTLTQNNKKDLYEISINIIQEQNADFNNKIELSKKLDPLNMPLVKISWFKSELIRKSAKNILEEMAKVFLENDMGRISLNEYLFNNSKYDTTVGNHQLGGTRMGIENKDSVVDKNLKAHGFENLYINGSSVFRTGGYAHPTYTIVKLALRLSNHITKKV